MFTINRSLCEIKCSIELQNIDIDVMEFITISFSEVKKGIGRYKKDSFISSIERLNGVSITTNQKSFKVILDEKIFLLFDNKLHKVVNCLDRFNKTNY